MPDTSFEQMPEHLKRGVLPTGGSQLQSYSLLFLTIDGSLQAEEQRVDVRHGSGKIRVYVRWAVPCTGFEWDGRNAAGTDRDFAVFVFGPGGEAVVHRRMRCTWFAVGHAVNEMAVARAIFECDAQPSDAA